VRLTADTNLLVRAVMRDDPVQGPAAIRLLAEAEVIAIPLVVFAELAWVLGRNYGLGRAQVSEAIRRIADAGNVAVDRNAVAVGLAVLERGGDFADGVIAQDGVTLGGETFCSFDRRAVTRVAEIGLPSLLPT